MLTNTCFYHVVGSFCCQNIIEKAPAVGKQHEHSGTAQPNTGEMMTMMTVMIK